MGMPQASRRWPCRSPRSSRSGGGVGAVLSVEWNDGKQRTRFPDKQTCTLNDMSGMVVISAALVLIAAFMGACGMDVQQR
jgi:hypothetical protein